MSKKIAHIGARPTFVGPKAIEGVVVEIDRLEVVMTATMAAELVRVVRDVLTGGRVVHDPLHDPLDSVPQL